MANANKIVRANIQKLVDVIDRSDELPEDIESAINDVMDSVARASKAPWYLKPFYKDGQFSKTAMFSSVATTLVLLAYFVQAFFAGTTLELGETLTWIIPDFDVAAGAAILTIVNGAYVGNNVLKMKGNGHG